MEFTAKKTDEANAVVTATLSADLLANTLDKIAKEASKTMDIQGFRKGKVPVAVVKQRYGAKLEEDANSEALRELYSASLKDLGLEQGDIIGEPAITKFDKKDDSSIDVQINISCKPTVDLGDYKALLPEIKLPKVTDKEVDDRIKEIASGDAPLEKIKRKRAVKSGDFAVIDFEGFKDGVAFEGGKAQKYTLEIGSNSFIPGFEDQVIGMKYDEEKEINVTFPKEYQSKDLAGADVVFKVKLHEIQAKAEPTIDDEFAKKLLPQEENATVELLKEKIKEQIENEKISKYYAEELKPVYLDALVEKIDFAVPSSILDQEIQQVINGEVRNMSEDEIKALQEDASKIEEMKKEATPVATQSVKATFIIDALAKAEGIDVTDQEVTQTIYYEAMMSGQDGQAMIKQYEEAGYLPAIKMSMMEQKVINKLLDEKAGRN
jgi:trigger factor